METFSYKYSAKENEEIQEIRKKYLPKKESKLDELKRLDAKVKRPVNTFAYVFGSVSAIVMGCGMSLVMTDIGQKIGMENTMMPGIVIGVIGMLLAIVNYPMYKKLLASRKKKYAEQILKLSETIMQ
jgi:hypothetical protein